MEPQQLTRETLVRRHQLRGSVLPVLTLAYNRRRQHLLTGDEQALRLFSTRKELAVLWLDPRSPSPIYIVHHAPRDVYIVAYDDEPSKHADASTVQILHASLAPLLRYKPHDDFLASLVIHTSEDSDWRDTSLRQEKKCVVQPDHRSYRVGKYGVAVRSASKEKCHFAIYAACTGIMENGDESATLKRVEPITRRLKVLAEMPASDLVEDFAAALEDATNRVENELALEKAIKEGKKASEIEDDMVRGSVQDQRKAFREQAKQLSMSFSGEVVEEEECAPAPAPGSDTLEAKAEAQASMEAWNVSLDELNNPENDEDAVAFEKLMYRMGLAHMKAEDKEAMKPLAVDNAHAPLAPLVKRKKKKGRRRRRRSVSPDRGETMEELDARWTIARGSDAWKSQVKATVAPRVDPMTLATPKPMRYHLLIDDKRYDHKPPPKSPTTGKRPTIPYSIQVTSATTHARRL